MRMPGPDATKHRSPNNILTPGARPPRSQTPQGNRKGLLSLADQATGAGKTNVAFLCAFLLGDTQVRLLRGGAPNACPRAWGLARSLAAAAAP